MNDDFATRNTDGENEATPQESQPWTTAGQRAGAQGEAEAGEDVSEGDAMNTMMNTMTYRGYGARIEYDADDRIFVGHLAGIRDIIGFHAGTVDELESAFHETVDDYLSACQKLGQTPNKPYSGKLMLQVPPEIHAAVATAAEVNGQSINQWASEALGKATQI